MDALFLPPGYADHMGLAQFRRRFQTLDPLLTKELDSASETMPERKVRMEEGTGMDAKGLPVQLLAGL